MRPAYEVPMTTETQAFGRLKAFIIDWSARWHDAREGNVTQEQWAREMDGIDERHFAEGTSSGPRTPCPAEDLHSPRERVTDSRLSEATARFQTVLGERYYEYTLVRVDDDWRVVRVEAFARPPEPFDPTPPYVAEAERGALLGTPTLDAELAPLPAGYQPNADRAFTPGKKLDDGTAIEVRRVGVLRLTSGVIGVQDFSNDCMPPLSRRLQPGEYPVDVAFARNGGGRGVNIAVRLRIGPERPTVGWHPATDIEGGEGGIGVDAGNVAIFDLGAVIHSSTHAHEQLTMSLFSSVGGDADVMAEMLSLAAENDGVAVESGPGDGEYPCLWGVDAQGELATLQIDFVRVP
jgi:hypothetical protein